MFPAPIARLRAEINASAVRDNENNIFSFCFSINCNTKRNKAGRLKYPVPTRPPTQVVFGKLHAHNAFKWQLLQIC